MQKFVIRIFSRLMAAPAYLKAEEDIALLKRDELRAVRLQLELLKPELVDRKSVV
jgi:hypothetical protein